MTTILVVESDPDISEFLTDVLKTELAAVVRSANTGMLGAAAIETGAFDLAIIDVLIPELQATNWPNGLPTRTSHPCCAPSIRMLWQSFRGGGVLI